MSASASVVPAAGFRTGRLLLLALIPGLLFIDMVNGITGGAQSVAGLPSPAEVVRGGITLWGFALLVGVINPALRRLQLWILAIGLLGAVALAVGFAGSGSVGDLRFDVAQLLKVLYAPLLILLLAVVIRRYQLTPEDVLDAVAWVAGVSGGSIIVLSLTGLGHVTYELHGVGSKGLFIAQNDIGLAMGLGLLGCADMLFRTGRVRYALLAVAAIVGMLSLGTRAALAATFIMPAGCLFIYRHRLIRGRRRLFPGLLAALAVLAVLGGTAVVKYRALQAQPFQQEKLQTLADNPFVRGILVVAAYDYVKRRPWEHNLVGEGALAYRRGVGRHIDTSVTGRLAEVDWMDMFGAYGLLFALVIYGFYFEGFRLTRWLRLRHGRETMQTAMLALAWFLAHSAIAGHALAGTIPGGTLAPILALAWSERASLRQSGVLHA